MLKLIAIGILFIACPVFAQSSCPAPTPGAPHVCLTWVASTTAGVKYNVYRTTSAGGENYASPLNASPLTTLSFYDTSVAIGGQYFYTITAVGTGGVLSLPSAEVQAQVPVPPNSPTTPAAAID